MPAISIRRTPHRARSSDGLAIRVIEYQINDGRANNETYRLFTTVLDPDDVSAQVLAATYAQR